MLELTAERLELQVIHDDAQHWLCQFSAHQSPQVIYLDPMYPPRHKSALIKKEMRLFRQFVGEDSDVPQLLTQALTFTLNNELSAVKTPDLTYICHKSIF